MAGINTGFSLADPILFGKLVNLAADHFSGVDGLSNDQFFWTFHKITRKDVPYWELGVFVIIIFSISDNIIIFIILYFIIIKILIFI